MRTPFRILTLVATLNVAGVSNAASTQVLYEMAVYGVNSTPLSSSNTTTSFTAQPIATGNQNIGASGNGSGNSNAYASATPGILKASISSSADNVAATFSNRASTADSRALANFIDEITINPLNTGLIGNTVTVSGNLLLSGIMLAGAVDNNVGIQDSYGQVFINVSGTGVPTNWGCTSFTYTGCVRNGLYGGVAVNQQNLPPSVIPFSFSAVLGTSTSIQYTLELQGRSNAFARGCDDVTLPCGALSVASMSADFGHSLLWGGITIADSLSNPIDFTVTSTSQFDYKQAAVVPVPAAAWLFGSGLVGLIGVARRKSR
ncbi:MAG: hypothetical protein NUV55_09330 [Sulfuricaulis sp.]|uniref:hypothetical protein n=1 Tax=Sulfuricaulis sp. TaxID=2003553 RepID=UPI0025DF02BC|nr:hypothetical protein [Sulfuricaulis sp.]MCR4347385.1 hypothetical protein [Sulfuricaulis sp.]